jgi:AraC-like DNA-binding protein
VARRSQTGLRLLPAIEKLNRWQSSTAIALSLGYRSTSAFVAAFRKPFGVSPQRVFKVER